MFEAPDSFAVEAPEHSSPGSSPWRGSESSPRRSSLRRMSMGSVITFTEDKMLKPPRSFSEAFVHMFPLSRVITIIVLASISASLAVLPDHRFFLATRTSRDAQSQLDCYMQCLDDPNHDTGMCHTRELAQFLSDDLPPLVYVDKSSYRKSSMKSHLTRESRLVSSQDTLEIQKLYQIEGGFSRTESTIRWHTIAHLGSLEVTTTKNKQVFLRLRRSAQSGSPDFAGTTIETKSGAWARWSKCKNITAKAELAVDLQEACSDKSVNAAAVFLTSCNYEENEKNTCTIAALQGQGQDGMFTDVFRRDTSTTCTYYYQAPAWQASAVMFILSTAIMLIIGGMATEQCLWAAVFLFCILGITEPSEVYRGLAESSVISLALLFPIAAAIDETGVLNRLVSKLLGSPRSVVIALMRMMIPVAGLSSLLSNTAITAMMIPVIVAWSRRLNTHPSKLLMPLSFASQLGGSCSIIGSSHCLVAAQAVKEHYEMGFFDLAYIGVPLTFITTLLCGVALPLLKGSDSDMCLSDTDEVPGSPAIDISNGELYNVCFIVSGDSLVGKSLEEAGLGRLPGVHKIISSSGNSHSLSRNDELACYCSAEGIVNMRLVVGIQIANSDEVHMMGSDRRNRFLYEVSFYAGAKLLGHVKAAAHIRRVYGSCILAVRRPGQDIQWRKCGEIALTERDIVVLEAHEDYVTSKDWAQTFSVACKIPKSSPPRNSLGYDSTRSLITCIGMVILVSLVTMGSARLDTGAGIFVLVLLTTGALTLSVTYQSIKAPILLTIAAAFGVATALQKSGLAYWMAVMILSAAQSAGPIGIYVSVYFLSVVMSMFINNSATIAIVATMMGPMAEVEGVSWKYLTWILVVGAGSCFTTPLGYQTNMMVMPDGGYTFTDFMRFGVPIQICHGIASIGIVIVLSSMENS